MFLHQLCSHRVFYDIKILLPPAQVILCCKCNIRSRPLADNGFRTILLFVIILFKMINPVPLVMIAAPLFMIDSAFAFTPSSRQGKWKCRGDERFWSGRLWRAFSCRHRCIAFSFLWGQAPAFSFPWGRFPVPASATTPPCQSLGRRLSRCSECMVLTNRITAM